MRRHTSAASPVSLCIRRLLRRANVHCSDGQCQQASLLTCQDIAARWWLHRGSHRAEFFGYGWAVSAQGEVDAARSLNFAIRAKPTAKKKGRKNGLCLTDRFWLGIKK